MIEIKRHPQAAFWHEEMRNVMLECPRFPEISMTVGKDGVPAISAPQASDFDSFAPENERMRRKMTGDTKTIFECFYLGGVTDGAETRQGWIRRDGAFLKGAGSADVVHIPFPGVSAHETLACIEAFSEAHPEMVAR